MSKAKSIITFITSTIRRLLKRIKRGRRSKATKTGLLVSDTTNLGVHPTHLIREMLKMTTKICMHELELIHDGCERCLYSRRKRWSRWRSGSKGISSILNSSNVSLLLLGRSRLLTRPLGLGGQLCIASPFRSLIDSTHDREEMSRRNRNMHESENACDSWKAD